MNETAARDVLLVRAIEQSDASQSLLSREDREFASRTATELARWTAAEQRAPLDAGEFLARRARLLLDKLDERHPQALRGARLGLWRPALAALLPAVALVAGAVFERLGDSQRINILALPLLGLVLWNLDVYLLLLLSPLLRRLRVPATAAAASDDALGMMRSLLRRAMEHGATGASGPLAAPTLAFNVDWRAASAALTSARLGGLLHLCAALFALGAVLGMYLRGLVFDYRAVWESTFLGPSTVHALLSTLLGPAAQLIGDRFPSVAELSALRYPPGSGESAARWIHWYALTIGALVILPRAILAWIAGRRAGRLARRFPLDLAQPYFRRLLGALDDRRDVLRVIPFSLTLGPRQRDGLERIVHHLWGERSAIRLESPVRYDESIGSTDSALEPAPSGNGRHGFAAADDGSTVTLTLALCSLAATPERENHGRFLDELRTGGGTPLLLVDTGGYTRRLGSMAGAASRLDERCATWRAFADSHRWPVLFADLEAPDLAAAEQALAALSGR